MTWSNCKRYLVVLAILATSIGCTPNCGKLVGEWGADFQGDQIKFVIRKDYSLTTVATGAITAGSWSCVADDKVLLADKNLAPMNLQLLDAQTAQLSAVKADSGIPELKFQRH